MTEQLLEIRDLDVRYGLLQVLFGVNIDVAVGERVALLGTNGAGKSTCLRAVSGLVRASSGSIIFKGVDVTRTGVRERLALGMVHVAGGRATFPSLTVLENLRLGAYPFIRERHLVATRLDGVLALFPQLRERLKQPAGSLSGGEQQMMALGRALVAGPELLMIDELSLGLAPIVMAELVRVIDDLVGHGVTLLLVEQSINVAVRLAQTAYFLERGAVRFSGPTAELLERSDLARAVFFGAVAEPAI
ncbi:MAG: ABC transporter ATP-binding protein [Actinomycetes bacterium]